MLSITTKMPVFAIQPELRKQGEYNNIIICCDGKDKLDLTKLNDEHIKKYGTGISYHYILMQDGIINYCRLESYNTELPGGLKSSILICVEGDLNSHDILDSQKQNLINLCVFIAKKYCLPWYSIKLLSDMIGGTNPGNKVDWEYIKAQIKTELIGSDNFKGIVNWDFKSGIPTPTSSISELYSSINIKTATDASKITGNPISTLRAMNPHISDFNNIKPGIPVFYLVTPRSQVNTVANKQLSLSYSIKERIMKSTLLVKNKVDDIKNEAIYITRYDDNSVQKTSMYGGKPYPAWQRSGLTLPGYKNAILKITKVSTGEIQIINFAISPSTFSDNRQNTQQITKTNGGWFVMRTGRTPIQLQITGYMLDTKEVQERHEFLKKYQEYIEDKKSVDLDYVNDYNVQLVIEGREYNGYVQGIGFQKSAVQQFLYQYSLSFVSLSDRLIYSTQDALLQGKTLTHEFKVGKDSSGQTVITETLYKLLNR